MDKIEKRLQDHDDALTKQSEILTDLVIRITALEKVLIKSNIIREDEYIAEIESLGKHWANLMNQIIKQQQADKEEGDGSKTVVEH